jgi:phospholipid-translocating ATPase
LETIKLFTALRGSARHGGLQQEREVTEKDTKGVPADEPTSSNTPSPAPDQTASDDHDRYSPDSGAPYWKETFWEDVRVGDFVKIRNNESFPADIVICATSEDENVAYVETKNLDGETNLKSRHAVDGLTSLRTAKDCAGSVFVIDAEKPTENMYKLSAAVVAQDGKYPVDLQTVLLRGTVLRNTKWIIGVVMFTGTDTKLVMNSGGAPSKRSRVERQMNPQVYANATQLRPLLTGISASLISRFSLSLALRVLLRRR